jgi:hypothetical protein
VQGALGAGASAASTPTVADAINQLGLPEAIRQAVITGAGAAIGAVAGGTAGAVTGGNEVANNYLKHAQLQAKRDQLAACKDQACRDKVNAQWTAVSQKNNEEAVAACLEGSTQQCRTKIAEVRDDVAQLLSDPDGKGLMKFTPEASNNLKQAQEKYKFDLEVLAQRGNEALGTTYTGPDELAKTGYLTAQEASDLKQLRLGQAIDIAGAFVGAAGTKANANKPVAGGKGATGKAAEEAKLPTAVDPTATSLYSSKGMQYGSTAVRDANGNPVPTGAVVPKVGSVGEQAGSPRVGSAGDEVTAPFSRLLPGGGLQAHEDAGGHLLDKHVGKTELDLQNRLAAEPNISGSSSFYGRSAAEDAVSRTLDANQTKISDWLSGTAPRLRIDYSLTDPVGISVTRGAAGAVDARSARVILVRDLSKTTGYRILTGFPTLP